MTTASTFGTLVPGILAATGIPDATQGSSNSIGDNPTSFLQLAKMHLIDYHGVCYRYL